MRERRLLVLQHHPLEHPGVIAEALVEDGAALHVVRLDSGAPCPGALDGFDGVLAMGGPMGVDDGDLHPWLGAERTLLARAIAADLPTLGVCLGAQQLAAAAGAEVTRGAVAEIGWYDIQPTDGARDDALFRGAAGFAALEWHRDVFALPAGARALASSARCPLQAFRLGRRVYGLLFHLEVDAAMVARWREVFADGAELPPGDAEPDFTTANGLAVTMARRLFLDR